MAELRKILVSIPVNLLKEVDLIVSSEKSSRSEFVRQAMKLYLREKKKYEQTINMQRGYQEMAGINRMLAEYCINAENEAMQNYEKFFRELE